MCALRKNNKRNLRLWRESAGERVKLQVAHFKLCYSRAFVLRTYLLQTQEMLFDAHNHGGAVGRAQQGHGAARLFLGHFRQRWDRPRTAVPHIKSPRLRE
jgi:hypothetical protein